MAVSHETNLESYFEPHVRRAMDATGMLANPDVEHYLVTLLARRGAGAGPDGSLVDLELAARSESRRKDRCRALRRLGDHTLFTSGMFAERLRRRGISVRYYRDKGQCAYAEAAGLAAQGDGYHAAALHALARRFDDYVSVLRQLRDETSFNEPRDAHALLLRTPTLSASVWRTRRGKTLQ